MNMTKRTSEQWQHIFNEHQQSGLPIKQFCERNKIAVSNFYSWRKKLLANTELAALKPPQQDWQEITLPQPSTSDKQAWLIELNLPNGVSLKMRTE